jgi:6-phosphogluconolactonase
MIRFRDFSRPQINGGGQNMDDQTITKELTKPAIRTFSNLEAASLAAADLIEAEAGRFIAEKGFFSLVLTGGEEVRLLYEYLANPPYSSRLAWQAIHFFWGDERCLPPDHPESNYAMASRLLLKKVIAPTDNIHRMPGEKAPREGAREYEETLRGFFAPHPGLTDGRFPRFDFLLLGMGEDGHTASLFPGSPLLREEKLWAAAVAEPAGEPPVPRITLTLPILNLARTVLFLTAGPSKKALLDEIISHPEAAAAKLPAARVRPEQAPWWFHAAGD